VPAWFFSSLPSSERISEMLTLLQYAKQLSKNSIYIGTDSIARQWKLVDGVAPSSASRISVSGAFMLSSGLIFASSLEGCEPVDEFTALLEANRRLRREITDIDTLDSAVLQGCRMLYMALVWAARSDESVAVVKLGVRCAVTMGLYHAPVLALHSREERAQLLDNALHLMSQAW
jgi:hypothetical protein